MLICFHFSWLEIFITVYNCIFVWCNLIFNLKGKLNHGPKEKHKVVFRPLAMFFLFHATLDLAKVKLICLEKENNLLTSLTITKTTTLKCPLNRIRIILFSFTNPQLNLVTHIKDNTKDFKLHTVHHFHQALKKKKNISIIEHTLSMECKNLVLF